MTFFKTLAAALVVSLSGLAAQAAPVTFIQTTLDASGTLDGVVFGTSDVRVTATADTDDIIDLGGIFFVDHIAASIEINGVGTFDIVTATRTFVNQSLEIVGLSRAGPGGSDLLNGPENALFGAYDLSTSIGPVAGDLEYLQWTSSDINTSGGILVFDNSTVQGTFEAIVDTMPAVPLPAAGWLMFAGIGGLAALRRTRQS